MPLFLPTAKGIQYILFLRLQSNIQPPSVTVMTTGSTLIMFHPGPTMQLLARTQAFDPCFDVLSSLPIPQVPRAIRYKSGQIAFPCPQISQRWSEHFAELFLGPSATWSSILDCSMSFHSAVHDPVCHDNITINEIVEVLKSLKARKACGTDGLPPGLFTGSLNNIA